MATAFEQHDDAPGAPVGGAERLATLDFVRGVAVLGILFANVTAFAQPYTAYFWPPALVGGMTTGDQWVWVIQFVLVDGKFRGLFTVLFGASMMLFLERAWARGEGTGLQLRRLAWLLAFGLAHFFLVWRGDILALYAVSGMVALLAVRLPAVSQLGMGLTLYLFGQAWLIAIYADGYIGASDAAVRAQLAPERLAEFAATPSALLAEAQSQAALYTHGSWLDIVRDTIGRRGGELVQELALVGPTETLGLILLGMGLFRVGFFGREADPAALRRWGWIGLVGGALLSVPAALWVRAGGFEIYRTLFVFNGLAGLLHFPMVLGLAALLVAWAPKAAAGPIGARFAAAGRMAFTNYLGTSLVMVALFQGWGLALFGRFHRIELLPFVAAGWAAMLLASPWWLARFHYGPLEWLWRCLTYGRLFALRRS